MPNRVKLFHLCALRGAVKLEKFGMVRSRRQKPARVIAIQELGLLADADHDEVVDALTRAIQELSSASTPTGT